MQKKTNYLKHLDNIMTINELKDVASQVRRDIIRMVHGCQSGHPGGSLGSADILTALYFDQMQIDPKNFKMDGAGEDMFFLSNGHISPLLYSVLARRGYFPVSELATFRRLGTRLQGHPTPVEGLPGVRVASGSLGQGLSVAIGVAQAKKLNGDNHLVFCLMGDGEQEEGQIWEAAMYAPAKNVDNLIAIIEDCSELLLKHKVDFDDRFVVGFAESPDGFRLTNLPRAFHDQRLSFWIVFPVQKILVNLSF